jgi:carbon storage regulator CsrA
MLVLSRKPNEEILIGENIKITVLKVKGNTVRIGIEAPQSVKVKRGELPADQPARQEVELTLSFSPEQEVVSASSTADQAAVLRFEKPANTTGRTAGRQAKSKTNSLPTPANSEVSAHSGNSSPGANRIKDILARLATGISADDLSMD